MEPRNTTRSRKIARWATTAIWIVLLFPFIRPIIDTNVQRLAAEREWDKFLSSNWGGIMIIASQLLASVYFWGLLGLALGITGTLWFLEWFGPGSKKYRPQFGLPQPSSASKEYVEWGIPVVVKTDMENCEVSFFNDEMPSIGHGIPLRWKTRDGDRAMLNMAKDVLYTVAIIARKEPPSKDLEGGAAICDDNYYKGSGPYRMIPAGKSGEFWIEVRSGLRRWRSPKYMARIPILGLSNGSLTVIPSVFRPQ